MILPSKHLSQDRALLTVGAKILPRLSHAKTVSALWEELSPRAAETNEPSALRYDSFVLTLDLLFLLDAIQLNDGLLTRTAP
jgi:hypothetical protein